LTKTCTRPKAQGVDRALVGGGLRAIPDCRVEEHEISEFAPWKKVGERNF